MNPSLIVNIWSMPLLIMGLFLLIAGIELTKITPFCKLSNKVKRLEVQLLERGKAANLHAVKLRIDDLFKQGKIDGMEREYLIKRLETLVARCMTRSTGGPKYAPGGPEDRIYKR